MFSFSAGLQTETSLLEVQAPHVSHSQNPLICSAHIRSDIFPSRLEINFVRTGAAEPHQTSTPAAAVLRAAQSKTTFASESLF